MAYFTNLLLSWGPWGVLLVAVVDSAGIPIPDGVDALLVLLASHYGARSFGSAALASIGSIGGNAILYYIGRRSGELYFEKRAHKPATMRFRRWYLHYGLITCFIPALLPIPLPLKVFVISAGVFGISFRKFFLVIMAARIPRYFAMTYMGWRLGVYTLTYLKSHLWILLGVAVGMFLAAYALVRVVDYHHGRSQKAI